MKAILALEDGTFFTGEAFGAVGEQWGEVVFNTGMTGYQEVLTDPSYCGQIVVMTYPLIGNYGINKEDFESKRSFVRGFIVREVCDRPSNWRASYTVSDFLAREKVIGLAGVDTRALTRHLRSHGTMRGIISTDVTNIRDLVEKAGTSPDFSEQVMVPEVSTRESYTIDGSGPRVVVVDYGSKLNIVRCLQERGCEIIVVPYDAAPEDVLGLNPAGLLLSNGPGDPSRVPHVVENTKALLNKLPIFGICLGHQVIAQALGAKNYKMKFGHRGSNHPVKDLRSGKVYITTHNHGFSIDENSLKGLDVYVSHRNLNDNTVEGIVHKYLPIFSVQYHPEASPGPMESGYLFDEFIAKMNREVK
ncbi:glutamine-hydrolyzing carbamoyl-phosphate synthase small subunit [Desulfolucanica intricata]|uniref:glutamine-hydrolyzing carbamoyl-phosphate synthase small subunit n=1 Tax=Desulfolucanica intricata TaxID=1285191 RepID=UPI00083596A0|nr:glutamine-hydrolyzing carbamoyl-phosphate synthase small subunit [Desulfolucanica intricata]